MNGPRIGSMFSGSGMLDEGVRAVVGGTVAWHVENDPAASKVLAYRYPGVPNLHDVTAQDWTAVEPVDVLTGGSPCQDVSSAGKRAGMRPGTRSGLWASMCDAIDIIRPRLVVWENVGGALSASADSAVEPCPFCVGDGRGPHLRALGRVVGDLSELGYDAEWVVVRASDVGAAHGRRRVFVVAWPAGDTANVGHERRGGSRGRWPRPASAGRGHRGRVAAAADTDGDGFGRRPELHREPVRDGEAGEHRRHPHGLAVEARGMVPGCAPAGDAEGFSDSHESLRGAAARLDVGAVAGAVHRDRAGAPTEGVRVLGGTPAELAWGPYESAIRRWERVLGRPVPAPMGIGSKGQPKLSPAFDEWHMGWPEGWASDVPGVSWNDVLRMCGNGVVPQQAAAAVRFLLARRAEEVRWAA